MAISDKLNYLIETKQLFKDRLNSLGAEIIESTTFRNYLNWLDNMYNKVSDKTDLTKNGIVGRTSQDGEPTPESPVEIKNLSGDISYKVSGNGISRTFPLSLKSKNLFDKDNANILNNAYLNNSQSKIASGNGNKILYISIEGGKTYTISKIASSRFAVATTSVLPSINTTTIDKKQNNDATSITLATSLNAKYLCVFYLYSADTINEQEILNSIQIEQSSTATDFEPYYDIELCKIVDYKNRIYSQDGKFYLHKEIEKISGTVNWVVNSITSNNRAVIPLVRIGYPLAISGYSVEQCLSNYFQKTSQQEQSSSTEINTISANNDNIYIKFDSSINTTSLAKTKLDSMTDLIIYYPPVTPTTTEITEENYPTLYGQLKSIQNYLIKYKINNEFLLDYSSPEIEY